jgi:hypothetical protein
MGSPGSELSPGVKGRELPGPAPMEMNAPEPPGGPEQVERANAEILNGLKTCTYDGLNKHGKKWIDELPCALWGNRTSPSQATERHLSLWCMGPRPSFPREVTMCSVCVKTYDKATQDQLRREDIDRVDERRWQFAIKNARNRQALRCYHQRFTRSRELQVDDLVLRRVLNREAMNKLSPCCEGSFRVTQVCQPGCVRLVTEE